jgi:hypothetical protein
MKCAFLLLLVLSGCIISPPAKEPPEVKVMGPSLPPTVWPDACVADWYAKQSLPPCVETWITDVTKQQKKIEKKQKHLRHFQKQHVKQ